MDQVGLRSSNPCGVTSVSAPVKYTPNFVKNPDEIFDYLWENLPWERRPDAPRRECWMNTYGLSYTYGRGRGERTYQPVEWNLVIGGVQLMLFSGTGVFYQGCFVNGYEGPRDHLGWHADDDPKIDHSAPIAIVSLGFAREIWFRENGSDQIETQLLENGSLSEMGAGMQFTHQHRIPKHSAACGRRISLTFRGLVNPT